jgi:hypothetical protein
MSKSRLRMGDDFLSAGGKIGRHQNFELMTFFATGVQRKWAE